MISTQWIIDSIKKIDSIEVIYGIYQTGQWNVPLNLIWIYLRCQSIFKYSKELIYSPSPFLEHKNIKTEKKGKLEEVIGIY